MRAWLGTGLSSASRTSAAAAVSAARRSGLSYTVTEATSARYVEAYERISGRRFADWPGAGS